MNSYVAPQQHLGDSVESGCRHAAEGQRVRLEFILTLLRAGATLVSLAPLTAEPLAPLTRSRNLSSTRLSR